MGPDATVDLLWISMTINLNAALFLALRAVISWVTGRFAEEPAGSWRRSLFILHDDKPWVLSRFLLLTITSAGLCLGGFLLLGQGDVFREPFLGLTSSARACFAINIGCYMYLLVQDTLVQRHLTNYYVTFTHHLVAAVVYIVFLEYKQNALSGAAGLFFAVATPFFEMADLLNEGRVDGNRCAYGVSLALSGLSALMCRVFLPVVCAVYSYTVASPFTMDIVVLSCYFLALVFFGMLDLWSVYLVCMSFHEHLRFRSAWSYMKPLQDGKPHGLDVKQRGGCGFTAKRNDFNFLAPCSNTNLAASSSKGNGTDAKNYHKIDLAALFNEFKLETIPETTERSSAVSADVESIVQVENNLSRATSSTHNETAGQVPDAVDV